MKERRKYAIDFLRLVNSEQHIIFFDETGFNISMRNYYGRSLKGRRELHVVPAIKSRNRTIMAAMNRESEENCQNYYRHVINNILSCIEGKCIYNE